MLALARPIRYARTIPINPVLRQFHSAPSPLAQYHFDTADYVTRLESHGLSRTQAEGVIDTLEEIIGESIQTMQGNLVTRAEQDKHHYQQKVDFASLKQTLELSEKTDFVNLKAENERLLGDIERLKQRLREEITRTQAGVRLDLNLEKGRIRDELSTRVVKLADVDTRIENEIGLLRTSMEAVKFNILQYAFAVMSGTGALLLAYLRMFAH
ncbi:mitochondrion protein [Leucosporidium creatinivorum]|uniref:Mitochondrion protein n=1 Tax=Leucosporidium creatinivorum TaxID=106004 RepID=A0A1Y2FXK5_9BASI|nr:mitochondrion protein [Leucosporidium creatinivorum]